MELFVDHEMGIMMICMSASIHPRFSSVFVGREKPEAVSACIGEASPHDSEADLHSDARDLANKG